jgi:hypothetical protein
LAEEATALQQRAKQLVVDAPQTADPDEVAQVMQEGSHRPMAAIGQMSEATPSALLREHLDDQIEGMRRGQQTQEQDSIKLGWMETHRLASPATGGPQFIDEIVRNKGRQLFKKFGRAGGSQREIHRQKACPEKTSASAFLETAQIPCLIY